MTDRPSAGSQSGKDLPKQTTLSGSESIARAVIDAGVRVAASYPGGPITQVVEKMIELAPVGDLYVEWSNCEKVAFEVALGCSIGGRRAVIAAKHVGINHILDPLMTVNLTGSGAGLVILAGDDPGSYGSQNEQDSRLLGAYAEIPILEPANPDQGYRMTRQAFRLSEDCRLPVMVRYVADFTADAAPVATEPRVPASQAAFNREVRWSALPALVVEDHAGLHQKLQRIAEVFDQPPYRDFNHSDHAGRRGIIAAGHMAARLRHYAPHADIRVLELGTLFPLPEQQVADFLTGVDSVHVLEEVEPFIENQVRALAQRRGLQVKIYGKTTGHVPWEGDIDLAKVGRMLIEELGQALDAAPAPARTYPSRQPFGDGCSYSPFFSALQQLIAEKQISKPIVVGETGCLVRLHNPPFEMLDVKYSMGSSIGLACGLWRSGVEDKILAVAGDSVFFHTAINGLLNAAHHQADIVVAIMDNETVALTGFQKRTGAGTTAMGETVRTIYPEKLAAAMGIDNVYTLDAFDEAAIKKTLHEVFTRRGLSFLVVRGRCPHIESKKCRATRVSNHQL
ncbi:Indolepyruvate oxidoreductase subunit IorA (EC [Olavius algarvensis Delta 1 endosymbiont]|nr:Indolepyruvate oxidoreductase subunit IorA (EC [Olavius algarvensis Delta 1 endosymbiont]